VNLAPSYHGLLEPDAWFKWKVLKKPLGVVESFSPREEINNRGVMLQLDSRTWMLSEL
jgi:hypothetical protein